MFDGLKAVFIGIYGTPEANPLTVIDGVRKIMPSIQAQLPASLKGTIAYDSTQFIRASIWEVAKTLAEAAGIVIVVIFLFLGNFRSTLIPIVTIPLSLIGVMMQDIGVALSTMLGGNYVNLFSLQGRSYQVIPQAPRSFRLTPEWLERYQVRAVNGELVPLSAVATVSEQIQPNSLTSFQQLNSATLSGVPFPGRTLGETLDFLKAKSAELFPEGYSYDFQGDSRQYEQEGNSLVMVFVFALIVIYLVLAAQYESFRDPFIILIGLPTALFGALLPLNIGGSLGLLSINIYTQIGLVTLIGLISKHGILMVDFANQLQEKQGYSRREAIEEAASVRLRPILMTTAAMVVGMIPLIIASGAGARSRADIGLTIFAGMSIGTLFTLFVTPMVYTFIARDHAKARAEAGEPDADAREAAARAI